MATEEETAKALEQSIAHWKRLATGELRRGEKPETKHCALCCVFIEQLHACDGCPVKQATGERFCYLTPYRKAHTAFEDYGIDSEEFQSAARKELAFLEGLREERK